MTVCWLPRRTLLVRKETSIVSKRHTEPTHPNVFQFEIVETPQFVAAAEKYLPATQRLAFYWLLAMNPLFGGAGCEGLREKFVLQLFREKAIEYGRICVKDI